jgi:hypothetical protein
LYIPEADLEYLIRTLSEARSRATELSVAIGSRLGSEHRLTGLANTAASNIEATLREVRSSAAEEPGSTSGLADLQGALQATTQPVAPAQAIHTAPPAELSFAASAGLDAEHWLTTFVDELLQQARTTGRITFEGTERLLQQRKDEFLRDFLTARRMYRAYPQLFPEIAAHVRHWGAPQKEQR